MSGGAGHANRQRRSGTEADYEGEVTTAIAKPS